MTNSNKRGGTVATNELGTLERVDGTGTYVGTLVRGGRTETKRFRGNVPGEAEVVERWERWQQRKKEAEMAKGRTADTVTDKAGVGVADDPKAAGTKPDAAEVKPSTAACPLAGRTCGATCPLWSAERSSCALKLIGVGLMGISEGIVGLDVREPIELLALAVSDKAAPASSQAEHTADGGVAAYMSDKTFIAFVNLHSKTAYSPYKKFCEAGGYPSKTESAFTKDVLARFPELRAGKAHGGVRFEAA